MNKSNPPAKAVPVFAARTNMKPNTGPIQPAQIKPKKAPKRIEPTGVLLYFILTLSNFIPLPIIERDPKIIKNKEEIIIKSLLYIKANLPKLPANIPNIVNIEANPNIKNKVLRIVFFLSELPAYPKYAGNKGNVHGAIKDNTPDKKAATLYIKNSIIIRSLLLFL